VIADSAHRKNTIIIPSRNKPRTFQPFESGRGGSGGCGVVIAIARGSAAGRTEAGKKQVNNDGRFADREQE
jgi:hypothetical protein